MKRPTRRRMTTGEPTVDCRALLSYIMRRCEGCAPDYYLVVADNFFDHTVFPDAVREEVVEMLQDRLARISKSLAASSPTKVPLVMNGSVVCRKCGKPVDQHPVDTAQGHLTVLCTGQRVRLA